MWNARARQVLNVRGGSSIKDVECTAGREPKNEMRSFKPAAMFRATTTATNRQFVICSDVKKKKN
jgi:hypothetical protein